MRGRWSWKSIYKTQRVEPQASPSVVYSVERDSMVRFLVPNAENVPVVQAQPFVYA